MNELEQFESELKNINYTISSLEHKINVQKTKKIFIQDQIMKLEEVGCNV